MSGLNNVRSAVLRTRRYLNRERTISSRNARGHTFFRFNRNRKVRAELGAIATVTDHHIQA